MCRIARLASSFGWLVGNNTSLTSLCTPLASSLGWLVGNNTSHTALCSLLASSLGWLVGNNTSHTALCSLLASSFGWFVGNNTSHTALCSLLASSLDWQVGNHLEMQSIFYRIIENACTIDILSCCKCNWQWHPRERVRYLIQNPWSQLLLIHGGKLVQTSSFNLSNSRSFIKHQKILGRKFFWDCKLNHILFSRIKLWDRKSVV